MTLSESAKESALEKLEAYGYSLSEDDRLISPKGTLLGVQLHHERGRFVAKSLQRMPGGAMQKLWSGSDPGRFVKDYYYAEPVTSMRKNSSDFEIIDARYEGKSVGWFTVEPTRGADPKGFRVRFNPRRDDGIADLDLGYVFRSMADARTAAKSLPAELYLDEVYGDIDPPFKAPTTRRDGSLAFGSREDAENFIATFGIGGCFIIRMEMRFAIVLEDDSNGLFAVASPLHMIKIED